MRFSLLALALLFAAPAFAQSDTEPLRPGDIDVSELQPYQRTYGVVVKQGMGGGMPFGTVTEALSVEDGIALVTVVVNSAQGVQNDSIWFNWPTMEPVRYRSEAGGTAEDLQFDGLSVSGTLRGGDAFDATLQSPVFGASSFNYIAATLPMEEGATATYAAFNDEVEGHEETVTITVGATQDMLDRTARVVTRTDAEETRTYYFDEETREVLGFDFVPQPGITVEIRRNDLE
ncbi:MAG: hypothetical protein AAGI52_08195 [Bacteroidota bacterium]